MLKKLLLLSLFLFTSSLAFSQVTLNESGGWLESAFVKWQPVSGAYKGNVYYTGGGQTDKKIDTQLIRSYGTYFRADVLGLKAGTYTIAVAAVTAGVEGTRTSTSNITVLAHDRNGFAFQGGSNPSAYNMDGTPKTGAVILYITQNTKNTISLSVTGATTNPCVGLQTILDGFKKGKDTRPLIVRLIGNITDLCYMTNGDVYISNANNAACSITFEGVGEDAVTNGWSVCLKAATNIEVRNLAAMNNNSVNGDDFGLQQDNDHVWIHNNDMYYGNAGSDADQIKGDGAMDVKLSTYVTISYNHFWDNGKCSLLGLSENTTSGLYITYHHNWFDHSDSRHPRVRFYSAHIYNNYFDGNSKYGAGSTNGSSLFVENNYYRNSKHPMMTSLQGTDVWSSAKQANDPANQGTFSGEVGGTIKAFNNTFDADIATNDMRYVKYGDTNPVYNIANKISSLIDFDAYEVTNRGDQVPATVKSFAGANMYNNFDTDAALYVKNLVVESPTVGRDNTKNFSGRVNGGDLKWTFNNTQDDTAYLVNTPLKTSITNYTSGLVAVQGETVTAVSSQTLTTSTDNNQTVADTSTPITSMIYTWGGDATDVSVTGLPASGITYVKDTTAKTITITGTPSANVSFTITTIGATGTAATGSGTITINGLAPAPAGDEIHNFTLSGKTSTFYTISGNLSTIYGTATYEGLTLTQCLKMESSTNISFTTASLSTLILIFGSSYTGTVKVDGTTYTPISGIVTVSLNAGTHTILRIGTNYLFYMKVPYSLGLNDLSDSKFILYPNPVSSNLHFSSLDQIEKIEVYTISGALVKQMEGNDIKNIDLSTLIQGSYLIKLHSNQGVFQKIIIKK